jgi:hypothetical protein
MLVPPGWGVYWAAAEVASAAMRMTGLREVKDHMMSSQRREWASQLETE